MRFSDLSVEQATTFRDHVVAREPYMLRELAQWMARTGGPLDVMDASVASLDRIWEWYIGLAHEGFRGLTEGLVPASWPELAFPLGEPGSSREIARQSHVAGDRLMHYVRLVLTRLVPGAHRDVFVHTRGPREAVENETALFFPRVGRRQPRPAFLDNVGGMASRVIRRQEVVPARLRNAVGEWSPVPLPASQDPHPPVLLDYLDVELPPVPALAATSPAIAWLDPSPAPRAEAEPVGQHPYDDMVLAHGPAVGLDDEPWLLRALPAERIAAVLRAAGFTGLDERSLLAHEEHEHPDGLAQVQVLTYDGSLRALWVEPANATADAWDRLVRALQEVAAGAGARFVPQSDYDG